MKWIILAVVLGLAGCHTNPPKRDQLILNVPEALMKKPDPLEPL